MVPAFGRELVVPGWEAGETDTDRMGRGQGTFISVSPLSLIMSGRGSEGRQS